MDTKLFDYHLPPERIAQTPVEPRDASRLMLYNRAQNRLQHHHFYDIPQFLRPGDILVANDSRVIPARLYGHKPTGGQVELLLLKQQDEHHWRVLAGGKKLKEGTLIHLTATDNTPTDITATITAIYDGPQRQVRFNTPITPHLNDLGHTPLPPYITTPLNDPQRYQTIYARPAGSAAAPTAGLHFTPDLLLKLRQQRILFETVTLHVGLDTFKPVTSETVADHNIHSEWITISPPAAQRINEAKLAGGRLIAIGTTAMRVLETAAWRSAGHTGSLQQVSQHPPPNACPWRPVAAYEGDTDLYIYPGYQFRAVDALITNFHLPQSSLLMLVAAFMGREQMLNAYQTAINQQYRFYSFGDAMLIL
ncbi:MAG TPA: tRNA preQ1(34) S-adenosylmethionine ribosyltransferase-isomerase QueA [Anaerolineae bacterium]|nr:tRNA preQ1(34) S-adenosylmethionine ribosyltransferase-isomerase QueA [Anaerolineae bacterium]